MFLGRSKNRGYKPINRDKMSIEKTIAEKFPYVNDKIVEWHQRLDDSIGGWSRRYLYQFWQDRDVEIGVACSPVNNMWYWQICDVGHKDINHSDGYYKTKQEAEDGAYIHLSDLLEMFPDDMDIRVNYKE